MNIISATKKIMLIAVDVDAVSKGKIINHEGHEVNS